MHEAEPMRKRRFGSGGWWVSALLTLLIGSLLTGCASMRAIDRKLERVMRESSQRVIPEAPVPAVSDDRALGDFRSEPSDEVIYDSRPATTNPTADELTYVGVTKRDYDAIERRLEGYSKQPAGAEEIDLVKAFKYAQSQGREHRTAEEDYILAAIRLLIERHQWGPRFFHELSTTLNADQSDGEFDTALRVMNSLRATQQLPYGGELEASLVTQAAQQLTTLAGDQYTQSSTLALSANIPLLRGAGEVAREDLIQAERDLVYAARAYERARRTLLVDIANDYFSLVAAQMSIANQEIQVVSLGNLLEETREKQNAGTRSGFDVTNVEQQYANSRARLINLQESYRLAVDRFKIRLGFPMEHEIVILPRGLVLPDPIVTVAEASRNALMYRLDYQNRVDQLVDSRRGIRVAQDNLLPDLDLGLSGSFGPDPDNPDDNLSFDLDDSDWAATVTFGLPLDREIERLNLRAAMVRLERDIRGLTQFRDNLILDARRAVRAIDQNVLTVRLRTEAIRSNTLRQIQVEIQKAETSAQERIDTLLDLLSSQNARDEAVRDLRTSILEYLLTTGQLRVGRNGDFTPLAGMTVEIEEVRVPRLEDVEDGNWDAYLEEIEAELGG